jgi:hypothetical protein
MQGAGGVAKTLFRPSGLVALAATNLATAVLVAVYVKGQAEGGVGKLLKRLLFSVVFNSLKVVAKGTVSKEQDKLKKKTMDMVLKHLEGERIRELPAKGSDKRLLIGANSQKYS